MSAGCKLLTCLVLLSFSAQAATVPGEVCAADSKTHRATFCQGDLSSPTAENIQATTADGRAVLSFGAGGPAGTLYGYVHTGASCPSAADIEACTGGVACASGAVSTTAHTLPFTGLTNTTSYRTCFVHRRLGHYGDVVQTTQWQTAAGGGGSALYDLGVIPARFDAVEFATPPTTSNPVTVSTQTELNDALITGNAITVAANDSGGADPYTGISISGGQTDIDITMASASESFSGGITISSGTRIRITGGDFDGAQYTAVLQASATHIILDNVNLANGLHLIADATGPNHISVLNSTITSPGAGYGILIGNGAGASHLIVANTSIDNQDADHAGIRWTTVQSSILIDGYVFTSGNRIQRMHSHFGPTDLVLFERNKFESDADHNLWLGPEVGSTHSNAMTRIEYHENNYCVPSLGANGVVQMDSQAGGGIDDVVYNANAHYSPNTSVTNNPPTNFTNTNNTFDTYANRGTACDFAGGADH